MELKAVLNHRNRWILSGFLCFWLGVFYGTVIIPSDPQKLSPSLCRPCVKFQHNGTCPPPGEEAFIQSRLGEAENNWLRGRELRVAAGKETIFKNPWDTSLHRTIWDFYYPTFDCPHTIERIGRVGDGGKWICGFTQISQRDNCIVYSYGVAGETSFEETILGRTNCSVFMYDPSVPGTKVTSNVKYKGRVQFERIGLGPKDSGDMKTLKTQMAHNGHKFIDILKVDIEGSEFEVFNQILRDFPNALPFGQLQIELHLNALSHRNMISTFQSWFERLEDAGLRLFNTEPNLFVIHYSKKYSCYEFAFINVGLNHKLLHA